MKNPRRNILKCYLLSFTWGLIILSPLMVPFFQSKHLSISQVFLVQSAFGATLALLDVPSGYFSDIVGRRLTIIIASLLRGFGAIGLVLLDGFYGILCSYMLIGAANSFLSGSDLALLYESHEEVVGDKASVLTLRGRTYFLGYAGITLAALVGGYIGRTSLALAGIVNAVCACLVFPLAFTIEEPSRKRLLRSQDRKNFGQIFRSLFSESPLLRSMVFVTISYNLAATVSVWMLQALWEDFSFPLVYFGYIAAMQNIVSALFGIYSARFCQRFGWNVTLMLLGALPIAAFFGASLKVVSVAIMSSLLFEFIRSLVQVVLVDELNRGIKPEYRATSNSIVSFCTRGLYVLLGPLVGFCIQHYGVRPVLRALCGLYVVVFVALCLPTMRRKAHTQTPVLRV